MKIYYDDIIYNLQSAGGISLYWSKLETYLNQGIRLLYKKHEKNIFFPLQSSNQQIINKKLAFYERYRNVVLHEKTPFVFHSSYYRYCKNKNAVNITTVHDFMHEYFRKDIKAMLFSIQKRNAIYHSAGIICNSENTKKDLLKLLPDYKGMIRVIYLGILENYRFLDIQRKNHVLFLGGRSGYKNFYYTIKLMEKLPDLKLHIISGGELNRKEISLLQNLIPNRYEYFLSLTNEELNIQYNEAKFLLYPSLYEGFGIPVVEAQAAGCPVVCCNVSSLPEIAGDAAVYISCTDLDKDLKVITQLTDQIFYNSLVQCGFTNCKRFSWKKCAEETYSFYNEVYENFIRK